MGSTKRWFRMVVLMTGMGMLLPTCPWAQTFPGTPEGARLLLSQFLAPNADHGALTQKFKPTEADYRAYFVGQAADKAMKGYISLWEGKEAIKPGEGQTQILLRQATTDDFRNKTAVAKEFPGGYQEVAAQLKPGVTVYSFTFVKPGQTSGMAVDGLVYLNGHWVLFPKPWRALK